MEPINVIIESGRKRTFASAMDWPGWSRSGRDEESALGALLDYGPRYARVLGHRDIKFRPPSGISAFAVTERLEGDATTDFGAPSIPAAAERKPIDKAELQRFQNILVACWQALDNAIRQATGKELRKGPRGGGRDLEKIVHHVTGSDQGYLRSLAWKPKPAGEMSLDEEVRETREAILSALEIAAQGELPEQGPRGGKVWPPRYFVRRLAWHTLDHVWEIEDRVM